MLAHDRLPDIDEDEVWRMTAIRPTGPTDSAGRTGALVVGAGKIGTAIASLLRSAPDYDVTVLDRTERALRTADDLGVRTVPGDTSDTALLSRLSGSNDMVLNAAPFHLTTSVARAAREAGAHYFDLTEDRASLDDYHTVARHSAEMAWIATEGNAFNHATDRVPDVEALRRPLRDTVGWFLKDTVERSRSGRVRQTALRATRSCAPCSWVPELNSRAVRAVSGDSAVEFGNLGAVVAAAGTRLTRILAYLCDLETIVPRRPHAGQSMASG